MDKAILTKRLSILWAVSYILMAIVSTIYTHTLARIGDLSPTEPGSPYQIITTLLVLVFFYPLLWIIHHNAKHAKMRKVLLAARLLLGLLSYWLICVFIMWCIHFSR